MKVALVFMLQKSSILRVTGVKTFAPTYKAKNLAYLAKTAINYAYIQVRGVGFEPTKFESPRF